MASPVEATLILCDAAVADPAGKVHMLGAGWSRTSSPTAPSAVVALLRIPWDRANRRLALRLALHDSDGQLVNLPTDQGPQSLMEQGEIEVGRPPGIAAGSPLDYPFVMSVPPLPLPPGRYEWRLDLAEQTFHTDFQVG